MAFGFDGRAYVVEQADSEIVAYDHVGKPARIASGIQGSNLVVTHDGAVYVTELPTKLTTAGRLWLVEPNRQKRLLDASVSNPTGITVSPDDEWLAVVEGKSHWGYSYRIQADHTIQDRERLYWFHVPDEADDSGAQAWIVDRGGRLYAATRMGV